MSAEPVHGHSAPQSPYAGNPRQIALKPHELIILEYSGPWCDHQALPSWRKNNTEMRHFYEAWNKDRGWAVGNDGTILHDLNGVWSIYQG